MWNFEEEEIDVVEMGAPGKGRAYLWTSKSSENYFYSEYCRCRAYAEANTSKGRVTTEIRRFVKKAFKYAKNISRFDWTHLSDLAQITKVESTLESIRGLARNSPRKRSYRRRKTLESPPKPNPSPIPSRKENSPKAPPASSLMLHGTPPLLPRHFSPPETQEKVPIERRSARMTTRCPMDSQEPVSQPKEEAIPPILPLIPSLPPLLPREQSQSLSFSENKEEEKEGSKEPKVEPPSLTKARKKAEKRRRPADSLLPPFVQATKPHSSSTTATHSILPINSYVSPPRKRRRPSAIAIARKEAIESSLPSITTPPTSKRQKHESRFKKWMEEVVMLPKYLHLFEKDENNVFSFIFDFDEEGLDDLGIWDKMNKLHRKRFLRFREKLMEENKTVKNSYFFLLLFSFKIPN